MASFRAEMVGVAGRAPRLLDEAFGLVHDFLWEQVNGDGGFRDRQGRSSVYSTMFGLQALTALKAELPTRAVEKYLAGLGTGAGLDFREVTSLAGCYGLLGPGKMSKAVRGGLIGRLKEFVAGDGGMHGMAGAVTGSMSGNFLGLGALDDLEAEADSVVNLTAVARSVEALRGRDGSYGHEKELPLGNTASTAAAVILLGRMGRPMGRETVDWLKGRGHRDGGFFATPGGTMRDVVSTGLALHGLRCAGVDVAGYKEGTLDFLDSLWSSKGGFHRHCGDEAVDCEHTFYALLALGHLAG